MLDPEIIKSLEAHGHNVADGLRALRPGGAMEKYGVRTHCPYCGIHVAESLKWFHVCDMRCKCGTIFDLAPFILLERWINSTGAQLPDCVFFVKEENSI